MGARRDVIVMVGCLVLVGWGPARPLPGQQLQEIKKLIAHDPQPNQRFGWSTAISGDIAAIGSEDLNLPGIVTVFERDRGGADNWGRVTTLIPTGGESHPYFGTAVAVDFDTLVVGARNANSVGAAYIYERNAGGADNWGRVKSLSPSDGFAHSFGYSVAIDGDLVAVGVPGDDETGPASGAVYLYDRNTGGSGNWGEIQKVVSPDPGDFDRFGESVSVSADTLVASSCSDDDVAWSAGSVSVFERDQGGPGNWGRVAKRYASDAGEYYNFGYVSVAGDTMMVGATGSNHFAPAAGAIYVFERDQGGPNNWGEVRVLGASDAEPDDGLGWPLSLDQDRLVAGASWEGTAYSAEGAAYVFERDLGGSANWGQAAKLVASDRDPDDLFGTGVGVSSGTVVVGAYQDEGAGPERAGSAYIFSIPDLQYVALGDSYSSGEGAGPYAPGTDIVGVNECRRAEQAWSRAAPGSHAAAAVPDLPDLLVSRPFFACSGATMADLNAPSHQGYAGEGPQLGHPELATADMVSITIGGNDAGFGPVLRACAVLPLCNLAVPLGFPSGTFGEILHSAIVQSYVGGSLTNAFNDVTAAAPDAKVFVLGYPRLFGGSCDILTGTMFDAGERAMFRSLGNNLNLAIRCVAKETGVHFVSPVDAFAGHEVCGSSGLWWIHGVRWAHPHESFHPNWAGQTAYARVLRDYIRVHGAGTALPPNPLPSTPPTSWGCGSLSASQKRDDPVPSVEALRIEPVVPPSCNTGERYVPGDQVRLVGAGFAPMATVELRFTGPGGVFIVSPTPAAADVDGNLSHELVIPADSPNDGAAIWEAAGEGWNPGTVRLLIGSLEVVPSHSSDSDADGVPDICDNCPETANAGQEDSDRDGIGDACDPCPQDVENDADQDGLCGSEDPCPLDPENDADGDGVCEAVDNCPDLWNPGQEDSNFNGRGDACEVFSDGFESGETGAWSETAP